MMYWGYGSAWGYVLMAVSMAAFWALVIGAVVLVVRSLDRPRSQPTAPGAEDVLAARYARGEIDETEYRQRLATLQSTSRVAAR